MLHIMSGISDIKSFFFIIVDLKTALFFFRDPFSKIHVHEIHATVAVDIDSKAFLPCRSKFIAVFFCHYSCSHITEQLVPQALSIDKFCSYHSVPFLYSVVSTSFIFSTL